MTDTTLVPGRARIAIGPVGTVAPVDAVTALGNGWVDVGNTAPDSLAFVENPTFFQVLSHQSDFPIRTAQSAEAAHLNVELEDFVGPNIVTAFGGGTLTTVTAPSAGPPATPGNYRYDPPVIGGRTNVSAIAQFTDGTKQYRLVIPVCFQDSGLTMKLAKTAATPLALTLAVVGSNGVSPWYLLTNDPTF